MSVDRAQRFPELDTPSLVIDLDAMERNIAEMAQVARAAGVHLRPHTKTHKSPEIAAMQIAAGARGITVAKVGEAEVMADAGIDDILDRVSHRGRDEASSAAERHGTRAHQCVTGLGRGGRGHRTAGHGTRRARRGVRGGRHGPAPHGTALGDATVELVVQVARVPGVEVVGLLTHEGQAYAATPQDMEPLVIRMGLDLVDTAERCAAAGVPIREISVGSTPTARIAAGAAGITEIRPGTYVFNDVQQMRVGVATEPTCAARVLATVVARPWEDRFVIDAGSKSLTSDGATGRRSPDAAWWPAVPIEFHLDTRSGVSPYLQVVHQVRQALRLGLLREGDQLPTVKDVVARLAINPNTVLKAYRELEHDGLVAARPGVGTFVIRTLSDASLAAHGPLRRDLQRWLAKARRAGLDDESIEALFQDTFRSAAQEGVA